MRTTSLLAILGLLMTSTTPAAPQPTPEARVHAFIADYFRVHGESGRIIDAGDFDAWQKVIERIDRAHFIAGAHSGMDNVMSGDPDHDPGEKIIRSAPAGDGE